MFNNRPTISVALCTYNGEKYLREQLDSIASQTLPPDEIIICDDASEDATVSVIAHFSAGCPIPVKLYRNEKRLGVMLNFRSAISLCTGNYIALSDQDDVWVKDKLKTIVDFFSLPANKEVQVVFTDLELVDQQLNRLGSTMWRQIGFNSSLQKTWRNGGALDILISRGNFVTGASIVMRSSFRREIDDILLQPFKIWFHDGLIALAAARTNSIAFIDKPTVLYRQHEEQVAGTGRGHRDPFLSKLVKSFAGKTPVREELDSLVRGFSYSKDDLLQLGFSEKQLEPLTQMIRHFITRQQMPSNKWKRMPVIIKELITLRYRKYSRSWIMAAVKDLFKGG